MGISTRVNWQQSVFGENSSFLKNVPVPIGRQADPRRIFPLPSLIRRTDATQ